MLSALRGTLKNAWRLGLMDGETYRRAVAVENVRAKVQPKGKAVGQEELAALFRVCAEDESPAGKGRRKRTVYLPESVCEHVKAWVEIREHEPGPLFCPVRMTGEVPISRLRGETLWYVLKRRQREAGLKGVTPHGHVE